MKILNKILNYNIRIIPFIQLLYNVISNNDLLAPATALNCIARDCTYIHYVMQIPVHGKWGWAPLLDALYQTRRTPDSRLLTADG